MGGIPCATKELLCGNGVIDSVQNSLEVLAFLQSVGFVLSEADSYFIISCFDAMEDLGDKVCSHLLKITGWNEADFRAWQENRKPKEGS